MKKSAFSLLEILITLSIISTLVMVGATAYYGLQKGSRDAKRIADIETIRSALELYKVNNSRYPSDLNILTGEKKYLQSIPQDPFSNKGYHYAYSVTPGGCNDDLSICTNYVLGCFLERSSNEACMIGCEPNICNYCTGPYGKK